MFNELIMVDIKSFDQNVSFLCEKKRVENLNSTRRKKLKMAPRATTTWN